MNELVRIILSLLAGGGTVFILWRDEAVQLTTTQYVIVALTVSTAAIHLLAGPGQPWLFLNGMGYLGLLLATYFLPFAPLYPFAVWSFIGYTLLTIVLYFVVHPWGMLNGILDNSGLFTKLVEVALAVTLGIEWYQAHGKQKSENRFMV